MGQFIKLKFCVFLFLTLSKFGDANTTCEESQKHFANLCFSPTPLLDLDVEWSQNSQPEDGWHLELGNDVVRRHFAEALRGELLSVDDTSIENSCMTAKFEHAQVNGKFVTDGKLFGFRNLTSKWDCNISIDFPGVLNCDIESTGLSKYHEYLHTYVTYSDNKNVQVVIACFPNGQAGWLALSISKSLTEEEKKSVFDHVTKVGFSNDDTVVLYNEKNCSNETKRSISNR